MKNTWLAAAGAFLLAFFMALKSFAMISPPIFIAGGSYCCAHSGSLDSAQWSYTECESPYEHVAQVWCGVPNGEYVSLRQDVGRDRSKDQPPLVRCCDEKDCHECGKVSKDEDE